MIGDATRELGVGHALEPFAQQLALHLDRDAVGAIGVETGGDQAAREQAAREGLRAARRRGRRRAWSPPCSAPPRWRGAPATARRPEPAGAGRRARTAIPRATRATPDDRAARSPARRRRRREVRAGEGRERPSRAGRGGAIRHSTGPTGDSGCCVSASMRRAGCVPTKVTLPDGESRGSRRLGLSLRCRSLSTRLRAARRSSP